MTVELGRYGVWRTAAGLGPELAVEIERLGYGAIWIGGSPAADLAAGRVDAGRAPSGSRWPPGREHVDGPGGGGRRVLPPDRGPLPGPVPARRGHRAPGGHPRVPQPVRHDRRLPGPVGRRRGTDDGTSAGRARAQGAAGGRRAGRGRAPVPDHTGAHPPGPRAGRARCAVGPGALRGPGRGRRAGPGARPARPCGATSVCATTPRTCAGWASPTTIWPGRAATGWSTRWWRTAARSRWPTGSTAHLDAGADHVCAQVLGDGDPRPALRELAAALRF